MNKETLKDEAGITLVELLAAISILSVVILLAGSIHMFGQRHFINQTESASQANDFSYALNVMSRDLRKEKPEDVDVSDDETKITVKDGSVYDVVDNQLLKDNTVLADSIDNMKVRHLGTYSIEIILQSTNSNFSDKKYETTIAFRGVSEGDVDD